jgi:hypothetical protein
MAGDWKKVKTAIKVHIELAARTVMTPSAVDV